MRMFVLLAAVGATMACRENVVHPPESYLFVWAGDSAGASSDFLGVIDASPASATYGAIVASLPTGMAGSHPHHTEAEMPESGNLLANGFHAGRTWLFDLTSPREPRIAASFADVAGYSRPHSFARLPDGNVLATFQYRASAASTPAAHSHDATANVESAETGGLVLMDERGNVIRSGSAHDVKADRLIYPYSALAVPTLDRIVSTTTDMNPANERATGKWVQFWRLSDLALLRSIELPPGPRGDENQWTGEPRLLPDGKSVYVHTFNCGLYLIRDIDSAQPIASFVTAFEGSDCGVPVLTGKYWLQTVPATHSLVVLDISDPERPRQVDALSLGDGERPHWVAMDHAGRRIVLNSGGGTEGNRVFLIDFDPATGTLALDERFRDPQSQRAGVSLSGKTWPHGFSGTAIPHGSVFSR